MTDWITQTQAGIDRWLDTQREWWTSLLESAPGDAAATSTAVVEDLQRQTVEAWRRAAYGIVDAQAQMLLAVVREQSGGDSETLVRRWTDAQREMWQGWLAVLGQGHESARGQQELSSAGQQMVESLRHAAEQLVRSQAQWAKAWASSQKQARRDADQGSS